MTTYKKIIASNNIFEVYEYEKAPSSKNINDKDDDYDPLDFENIKLELKDRKEERRVQTLRDARNTTRRLALMNFGPGDKFITLTYRKNMKDLDKADNDFKKFIMRFKYNFHLDDFKYLAVREFQNRGAIHYHMICNWQQEFEYEDQVKYYERLLGITLEGGKVVEKGIWGHGIVDIKTMDHVDNVGAYLIKYMTKNVAIELLKGKKVYLPSKGLERPLIYRGDEAESIIKLYGLDTKKEVFTNSYESEYLGKIVYKEYNMKRQ